MEASIAVLLFILGEVLLYVVAVAASLSKPPGNIDKNRMLGVQSVSVVIPVIGVPDSLRSCLISIRKQTVRVDEVVVIQQIGDATAQELPALWCGISEDNVRLVHYDGAPSKAKAVRCGLELASSEWVLMLDADTTLSGNAIERFLECSDEADAVYGVIAPHGTAESGLLNGIVKLEKLLSHAIWRPGRWAMSLGPNLPGQCYLADRSVLLEHYQSTLGYLDDVALTALLVASGKRLAFCADQVAIEEGRSSWVGLLSQRVRYTTGILQSFTTLYGCHGKRFYGFLCLLLHFWLYYGACIYGVMISLAFMATGFRVLGLALIGIFLVNRVVFARLAVGNLSRYRIDASPFWPERYLTASILVLAIAKTLGLLLVPFFLIAGRAPAWTPLAYRR